MKRQVRDATDIVELIGSYVSLRQAGSTHKGLCPFHEEKTPSFTVSPLRQTFKCFGCGAGGDVFSFVQLKENVSFPEALRMLADRAGIALEAQPDAGRSGPGKQDLARVNRWAQDYFRELFRSAVGAGARSYAEGRGLSAEIIEAFGLGYAQDGYDGLINRARANGIDAGLLEAAGLVKQGNRGGHYDTFRNRLMFPIVDATDRIIGFGGRTLADDPAKYLNSPATALFDKSNSLFGLNLARQAMGKAGANRAIVVEGYTDCMMAHQHGFSETVATLGTAMTEAHANLLRRYTDRLYLLFDSDEAGQRAADRAIAVTLTSGLDVLLARVPEGKDPCDYLLLAGRAGLENVLNQALSALEFKWKLVAREYEAGSTGPGQRRAIEAYLQQLATWLSRGAIDTIQKGLLVNQLSKILSLPAADLHARLDSMARRSPSRMAEGGVLEGGRGIESRRFEANRVSAGTFAEAAQAASAGDIRGAEQRALVEIVEVLLNEPAWYPAVEDCFEPTAIRDRQVAQVAVELVGMLRSGESFAITDLIGRFESPAFGRLITDLQERGERRGGFSKAIEGAAACLRSFDEARRHVAQASTGDDDERLTALAQVAMTPRFSTMRVRKKYM